MPAASRSRLRPTLGLLAVALLACSGPGRAALPSMVDAPIIDFRLDLFDDETSRKTSDLRGGTAIYHGSELVEIRDFTLSLFNRKDALALKVRSPKAMLNLKTRVAEGGEDIDVQGPGYALSGRQWRCDEPARAVSIRDQARVVFEAPLLDILK